MRKSLLLAGTVSLFLSMSGLARDPNGEIANYTLDKSNGRTSSVIKKGRLVLKGGAFKDKEGTNGVYPTTLFWDIKARWAGQISGEKTMDVPSEFFTPEFMTRLREEGTSDQGVFKLKHLGVEDVQIGVRYEGCDKVLAYDVDLDQMPALDDIIGSVFREAYREEFGEDIDNEAGGKIRNVKLVMYISSQVPVMGAVKIDVSGTVKGFDVQAGFDFVP